jgi:hypothetical protein
VFKKLVALGLFYDTWVDSLGAQLILPKPNPSRAYMDTRLVYKNHMSGDAGLIFMPFLNI